MKTKVSFLGSLLIIIGFALPIKAQWTEKNNGLYGATVRASAVSEDGLTLFAGLPTQGVYKSTNNGVSWSLINTSLTDISVDALATNSTSVFAGMNGGTGVFRSDNNGISWQQTGLTSSAVRCFLIDGSSIYAGTFDGIYVSTDNGDNWTAINNGLSSTSVSSMTSNGTFIFAGTSDGVFRSSDGGSSWTQVINGMGSFTSVLSLLTVGTDIYAGAYNSGIFKSTDNGLNWSTVNTGLVLSPTLWVYDLVVNGTNIFAGTINGVFLSTNDGASWSQINNGLSNSFVTTMAVAGSSIFAGTEGGGVYESSNNGSSWNVVNTGITNADVNFLIEYSSTYFAGTQGAGFFQSVDECDTWTSASTGLTNFNVSSFLASGTNYLLGTPDGIFLSSDMAASWAITELSGIDVASLALNGTDVFAGSTTGIYVSSNDGVNWAASSTGLTDLNIQTVAADGTNIFAGTPTGVFRSINNGASWTPVNTGLTNTDISSLLVKGTNVYASTFDGIFVSGDNGDNWSITGFPVGSYATFLYLKDNDIFATASNSLWVSTNDGVTWTRPDDSIFPATSFSSVSSSNTEVFVGTVNNGVLSRLISEFYVPTISSFDPTSATTGSTVTITGTYLSDATEVSFGGTPAASFSVVSPTSITAEVAGGSSGSVSVTTPGGTATLAGFTFILPPTISSFAPTSAETGSTVTINGTKFTGATEVNFGGTPAASFNVLDDITIQAVVGTGTSGSVSVVTPVGTATKDGFTLILPINLTHVTPTIAAPGSTLTIYGSGFSSIVLDNTVTIGGEAATVVDATSTTLEITIAPGTPTGLQELIVTTTITGNSYPVTILENNDGNVIINQQPPIDEPGQQPRSIISGDVNGDGFSDIITVYYSEQMALYLNDGVGGFGVGTTIGTNVSEAILTDLDSDNDLDIVLGSDDNMEIAWRANDGTGSFAAEQEMFGTTNETRTLAAADYDQDGDMDVLVSTKNDTELYYLANDDGIGTTFTKQQVDDIVAVNSEQLYSIPADIDGDNDLDVVSANATGNEIVWYENDGLGNFSIKNNIDNTVDRPWNVSAGDLDGDGDTDLSVALLGDFQYVWYENTDGAGTFIKRIVEDNLTSTPFLLQMIDLDGDGDQDLFGADQAGKWFENDGLGSFSPANFLIPANMSSGATGMTAFDLENDGRLDLISASFYSNSAIILFKNLPKPPQISDLSPQSVSIGESLTITGAGFEALADLIVKANGVTADIVTSTSQEIVITIPTGASFGKITVLNTVSGLICESDQSVVVNSKANSTIDEFSLQAPFAVAASNSSFRDFTSGDIDDDGRADLVVTEISGTKIHIFKNLSQPGVLDFQSSVELTGPSQPSWPRLQDVNNDGKLDLIVIGVDVNTKSHVYLNTSTPGIIDNTSFNTTPYIMDQYSFIAEYEVKDMDLDGRFEVVGASANFNSGFGMERNVSSKTEFYTERLLSYNTQDQIDGIAVGDLNGDGTPDAALTKVGNLAFAIYQNNMGPHEFQPDALDGPLDFSTGNFPIQIQIEDINRDGAKEIFVNNLNDQTITIYSSNASGDIDGTSIVLKATINNSGLSNYGPYFADLNGDGKLDLIVAENEVNSNKISLYQNMGNIGTGTEVDAATFPNKVSYDFNYQVLNGAMSINDFDGDGRADISFIKYSTYDGSTYPVIMLGADGPVVTAGPKITDFSPKSGAPGTVVSISGENFPTNVSNVEVSFGPIAATINSISANSIDAVVPFGGDYNSIIVTDLVQNIAISSSLPFLVMPLYNENLSDLEFEEFEVINLTSLDPWEIKPEDYDNDGDIDFGLTGIGTFGPSSIVILENTSSPGSISFGSDVEVFGAGASYLVHSTDLNSDGLPDIISSSTTSPYQIYYLENNSTASNFQFSTQNIPIAISTGPIRTTDWNNDYNRDIMYSGSLRPAVLLNDGATPPVFTEFDLNLPQFSNDVVFADLNEDGYDDLIYIKEDIEIYQYSGNPAFGYTLIGTYDVGNSGGNSIKTGDINNDGKVDVVLGKNGGSESNIYIFENVSTGVTLDQSSFSPVVLTGSTYFSGYFDLGDINGDGTTDIITADFQVIRIFENDNVIGGTLSASNFTTRDFDVLLDPDVDPHTIELVDIDNDGKPDIIFNSGEEDGSVIIMRNKTNESGTGLSDAEFLSYSIPGFQEGAMDINTSAATITGIVQKGTDLTALIPEFLVSPGATVVVNSSVQVSGASVQDFSSNVVYNVTSQDQTTNKDWTVTVTESTTPNAATDFLSYTFPQATSVGSIDAVNHRIDVEVIQSADLSALVAEFTLSPGAMTAISGTNQISGSTSNDFSTSPVVYTLTAEDGTTTQDWSIYVTQAVSSSDATDFVSFEFQGIVTTSTINTTDHTILAEVPGGTGLTNLIAVFQLSAGASANIAGTAQVSGTTANDFSTSQTYTIIGEDGTSMQDWVVTVMDFTDTEDPIISFSTAPSTSINIEGGSVNVGVTATDNVGVTLVTLNHVGIRSVDADQWTSLIASNVSGDTFQSTLTPAMMDELGLAFFFLASDAEGNTASTDTIFVSKASGSGSVADIPDAKLAQGGKASDWRMFSIPYVLDDPSIASIFEPILGTYNKAVWRLVRYSASGDNFQEYKAGLTNIEIGKGYWFNNTTDQRTLIEMGPGQTAVVSSDQLVTIPLDNGWTQVGNPYPFTITWSDVLTFNSSSAGGLKVFTGGTSLSDATTLEAFDGAYVFSDGTDVQVPFTSSPSSRSRIRENLNSIDQEDWEVKISIESGEFSNHIGKIGMSPEANEDKDNLDAMRVPRFVTYTDLTFYHPEFRYPWFSGDVVPRQEAYTWTFEASNNTDVPVMLKWDNDYFGENDYELFLEDLENGEVVSMRESDYYAYEKDSLRTFRIHYGKAEQLFQELSLGIKLGASYPNPFSTSTVIPFTLPEKDGTFNVRLEIFDILGNQIEVLCDKSFSPGIHKVEWNGIDSQANNVREGLYLLIMKISSGNTNTTLSQKILKR